MKVILFCILFISSFSFSEDVKRQDLPHYASDFHQPFWKSKSDVQKRMREEDLIVVSAETKKIQDLPQLHLMRVVAGGYVNTPFDFTYALISDYPKLKAADDHFQEVHYDKDKKILFIHVAALGFHARMHLKVNDIEVSAKQPRIKQIHWECIEGQFKGMKGVFHIEEIERQKTEISMTADYRSETLPLPKVLMGLGLEIIGRQVATQIRKYVLEQHKNR